MKSQAVFSQGMEHTLAQEEKSRPAVHHPFDELDFGYLTFDLSIIDG